MENLNRGDPSGDISDGNPRLGWSMMEIPRSMFALHYLVAFRCIWMENQDWVVH